MIRDDARPWRSRGFMLVMGITALVVSCAGVVATGADVQPLSVVVMDPLAAPLSCPCVAGYAQRDYDVLGEYLSERLGRPVMVTFAETIAGALEKEGVDDVHVVIGKDSVIRAQGKKLKLDVTRVARLTGEDGKTTQTGLIVVRAADPAQTVGDLAGYRILFGPAECDEKFGAARRLLEGAGVDLPPPDEAETSAACSDGACMIIDWGDSIRGAAVISSYAAPLLEGCGTIKKGDLRVVGETNPVPFVAAFATDHLGEDDQKAVQRALLEAAQAPGMLLAIESMLGFVPNDFVPVDVNAAGPASDGASGDGAVSDDASGDKSRDAAADASDAWPGWLGPDRNGRRAWLPEQLPASPRIVWRHPMVRPGLGGLAATDRYVILGDRDAANRSDVFRCLDAKTGAELWTVTYPAPGQLDYDNCPRGTPLIRNGRAYLFGAFGDLTCANLETGKVEWRTNVRLQFLAAVPLPWGTCSSPLAVDDMIVVNPGATLASIAAYDAATGRLRWQTAGETQGYGSPILATLGGVRQIVGHTQSRLCGWDPATGRELWTLAPPVDGDFNVPTPIVVDGKLLVSTENNGTRLFAFDAEGKIIPKPVAVEYGLAPQMSTPVAVGSRVYCVDRALHVLEVNGGLRAGRPLVDEAFTDFGPIVASDDRLFVQGRGGEFLLVDIGSDKPQIVSRVQLSTDADERKAELLTFPAIAGRRLFVRMEREVLCVDLLPASRVAKLE